MRKSWFKTLFVLGILFAVGCVMGAHGVRLANAQDELPAYETTDCPFDPAPNTECGYVTVPEDRSNPDSRTIRLATVIVRGNDPDVPAMLLSGGPGEITTPNGGLVGSVFQQIVGGRTLILFDQRGVGRSEPALACPEWVDAQLAGLAPDVSPEQSLTLNNDALLACGVRLESEGIDLDAYNSVENAADVADIIHALGYEQVNLLGISYGSLLAQHVMRDYSEVVRAAVIDSVLPLDETFFIGSTDTSFNAIDRLLDACAADTACNTAYPDLSTTLRETVLRYNENPVEFTVTDPQTGVSYPSLLTGDTILSTVIYYLYLTPSIPTIPQNITEIAAGNTATAEALVSQFMGALYALERGMQYSVQCQEDLILTSEADLQERYEALPLEYQGRVPLDFILENSIFDLCAQFPVTPFDASIKTPLVSSIPTLALAGEFDPVTPFGYAEHVASTLENSFVYTFPGVGHSVALASPCAAGIIAQFLSNPTTEPDASCIDEMGINFRIPGEAMVLESFISDAFSITGVIPEGWQEIAPGVFAQSASGSTAIVQQAVPGTAADLLALLSQQFGLAALPEATGARDANGLSWTLYAPEGQQGLTINFALTENNGVAYVIVLISIPSDQSAYYDGLFLPAIDALTGA